jgi:hypothetical protein
MDCMGRDVAIFLSLRGLFDPQGIVAEDSDKIDGF